MTDHEALFHRPLEVLRSVGAELGAIIPSVKLSRGSLDPNRYYVDIRGFGDGAAAAALERLAQALGMPGAARELAHAELQHYGGVKFFGVGRSRGRMAYRIYLGFTGNEQVRGHSAVSIDWLPGTETHLVKHYDELRTIPRAQELEILRACLSAGADCLCGDKLGVYEQCAEITRKARGALQVTRITEPASPRSSVAFNYYRVAHTGNREVRAELDALAALLAVPRDRYHAWLAATDGLRLIDVAAGQDAAGAPFVTIYHGDLVEPPAYWPEPTRATSVAVPAVAPSAEAPEAPRVYLLGELGATYVSETRRQSLAALITGDPDDPARLRELLGRMPWCASSLVWTLSVDAVPIYGLVPGGPYAATVYERMRGFLGTGELVAIAGPVIGSVRLMNGALVPVVRPDPRALRAWSPADLQRVAPEGAAREHAQGVFRRILDSLRSPGTAPQHRAMTCAALRLHELSAVTEAIVTEGLAFEGITCARSPLQRPGSDCWDVTLTFFHPARRLEHALLVCRFTVDTADPIPVLVGQPRRWYANR